MKKLVTIALLLAVSGLAAAALNDAAILYMPYNETTGNQTAELVGGKTGTLLYTNTNSNGTAPVANTANVWVAGKFGGAMQAWNDGDKKVMDAHIIGATANNGVQDMSVSFWTRRMNPDTNVARHIGWGSCPANVWSLDSSEALITQDETSVAWDNWDGGLQYDLLHVRYAPWKGDQNYPEASNKQYEIGFSAGGAWQKFDLKQAPDGNPAGETYDRLYDADDNGWGDAQWHNVIINIDGNPSGGETQRFLTSVYVDGILQNQDSTSGWGWGSFNINAYSVGANESLKGIDMNEQIDDYGVWGRLLTAQEIASISAGTTPLGTMGIPEPATMALLGLGALGLIRRKK